jgi:site-specific recombinase
MVEIARSQMIGAFGLSVSIFTAAFAIDFCYAQYFAAISCKQAHKAAIYSIGCYMCGTLGLWAFVSQSYWYMLPELLGLYSGTFFAAKGFAKKTTEV